MFDRNPIKPIDENMLIKHTARAHLFPTALFSFDAFEGWFLQNPSNDGIKIQCCRISVSETSKMLELSSETAKRWTLRSQKETFFLQPTPKTSKTWKPLAAGTATRLGNTLVISGCRSLIGLTRNHVEICDSASFCFLVRWMANALTLLFVFECFIWCRISNLNINTSTYWLAHTHTHTDTHTDTHTMHFDEVSLRKAKFSFTQF